MRWAEHYQPKPIKLYAIKPMETIVETAVRMSIERL
jgi:hypothetical protein